ncbi:MAG: hypothetical protein M3436_01280 [Pseudomonadota bacterium]|nr:hypothetical protein [Pseudomonadota bacterium]
MQALVAGDVAQGIGVLEMSLADTLVALPRLRGGRGLAGVVGHRSSQWYTIYMSRADRLKEEIGWLKVAFGIAVALDASLVAWLAENYHNGSRLDCCVDHRRHDRTYQPSGVQTH